MRLITDTEWARMARQRDIAHLARLRRELHAELETTQGALAAVTIIEAKRMLRRAAVSSDGAARIEAEFDEALLNCECGCHAVLLRHERAAATRGKKPPKARPALP